MQLRYSSTEGTGSVQYKDRSRVSTSNCSWQAWGNVQTLTGPNVMSYAYGIDTPSYYKRLREKEIIPMTPYRRYDVRGMVNPEHRLFSRSGTSCNPYTEIYSWTGGLPSALGETALLDLVEADGAYYVQAAAAKIYSSGWDGLTFAAELKQLRRMLVGFATRLVRNILSGRWDSIWLESRYGWRVLWYDMQDILRVIENLDGERKRYREAVGTTESTVTVSQVTSGTQYGSAYWVQEEDLTIGVRGTVVADIEPPKVSANLAVTSWELTSFSFVIDWILNVGQWIESMSFLSSSTSHASAAGFIVKRSVRKGPLVYTSFTSPWTSATITLPSGPSWLEEELRVRVPMGIPTSPLTQLRLDGLKVIDLLALLFSRLKR